MTIQELHSKLEDVVSLEEIGVNVFFLLKNEENYILKKADIRNEATIGIIESLINSIQNIIKEISTNDELQIINLSAADDRATVIYQYDLDAQPNFFTAFNEIQEHREPDYFTIENQKVFHFGEDELNLIDGYIIRIGDEDHSIMVYRKNFPVNVFKRNKIFLIKKDNTQFTTMQDDFIRIDAKIDFIKIDDTVLIQNISTLEKFCEFHQIISAEASRSIAQVADLGLVDNIEVLQERIDELPFARKLTRVSTVSPVFTLPKATIISFAKNHRLLKHAFKYTENGSILLDTKKSQNLFVRLLNDDFLYSQLTDTDYVTPAKDKLE